MSGQNNLNLEFHIQLYLPPKHQLMLKLSNIVLKDFKEFILNSLISGDVVEGTKQ